MWVLKTVTAVTALTFVALAATTANEVFYGPEKVADDGLRYVLDGTLSELPKVIGDSYARVLGDPNYWVETPRELAGDWDVSGGVVESPSRTTRTIVYEITNRDVANPRPLKLTVTLEADGTNPFLGRAWKITGGLPLYRVGVEKSGPFESADPPLVSIPGSSQPIAISPVGLVVGPSAFSGTVSPSNTRAVELEFFYINPYESRQQILSTSYILWRPPLAARATQDVVALAQDILSSCAEFPEQISNREGLCGLVGLDVRYFGNWADLSCSIVTMPVFEIDRENYRAFTVGSGQLRCYDGVEASFVAEVDLVFDVDLVNNKLTVKGNDS